MITSTWQSSLQTVVVTTTREESETVAEFHARHYAAYTAKLVTHPVDDTE